MLLKGDGRFCDYLGENLIVQQLKYSVMFHRCVYVYGYGENGDAPGVAGACVRRGESAACVISVVDDDGRSLDAVVTLRVDILDPSGREAAFYFRVN